MKLIIIDRDGVINQGTDDEIKSASEWQALPGSLPAISRLSQNGFRIIVALNQAENKKRKLDIIKLNEIHQKLLDHLSQYGGTIDAFFFCPHEPREKCECRKTKAGLLDVIAERLRISLHGVPVVGAEPGYMDAAIAAGAIPYFVSPDNNEEKEKNHDLPSLVRVCDSLDDVVNELIPE